MPEIVQGLLIGGIVAGVLLGGLALLLRDRRGLAGETTGLTMLQTQIEGLRRQLDTRLGDTSKAITNVDQGLVRLEESSKRILEVGRDISGLRDILQAPKLRGGLGELLLENLLVEVLPRSTFHMQHTFRTGVTVDALITLPEGSVPVDAKFPLEAYQRIVHAQEETQIATASREFRQSVRARIDEIADKYIVTAEGTLDFALMYVPAEAVYYEAMAREESLSEYARERHVFVVSPSTLYLYLATVAMGMKGLQIEQDAQHILGALNQLNRDFGQFKEDFDLVGTHLRRARDRHEDAQKKIERFGDRLEQVHALESDPTSLASLPETGSTTTRGDDVPPAREDTYREQSG
jgi:DNA recombination protein RmuC